MDRDKLVSRLMGTFLEEFEDHITTLNLTLISLERTTPAESNYLEHMRSLFRVFHSLKGAARSVAVRPVERVCHELEEILVSAREGTTCLTPEIFRLLFQATDALSDAARRLESGLPLEESLLYEVMPLLASYCLPAPQLEPAVSEPTLLAPATSSESDLPSIPARHIQREARLETASVLLKAQTLPGAFDGASMRVSSAKLDKLLARSSELLTLYRRSQTWQEELQELQESVRAWQTEWKRADKPLKDYLEAQDSPGEAQSLRTPGPCQPRAQLPGCAQSLITGATANIQGLVKHIDRIVAAVGSDARQLSETANQVDDEIRSLRMRPFSEVCLGLHRTVRDLALETNKEVELSIEGGEVELDRAVLERLKSPLLHLIRNAMEHGIEEKAQRECAGKSWPARITVSAALKGAQVEILVADDGSGIDREAIASRALAAGLSAPKDEADLANLIFMPGFSTASTVTPIAGRGVGLDVVATELLQLQGTVALSSESNKGTSFALTVPLTLTKTRVLFVQSAEQIFAFGSATVDKLLRIDPCEILSVEGKDAISSGGRLIPLLTLSEILKLDSKAKGTRARLPVVVLSAGTSRLALIVDELLTEQEVVVTGLGGRLKRIKNIAGATMLPDGNIVLILNPAELLNQSGRQTQPGKSLCLAEAGETEKKRLIVADDSLTTRILISSILEAAGYEVLLAADGADAFDLLQSKSADLIVSDVEMPRLDGFGLTEAVRSSARWRELPVILVTGLGKDQDKARGLKAGASAYVVKSDFDQTELLETISQLL